MMKCTIAVMLALAVVGSLVIDTAKATHMRGSAVATLDHLDNRLNERSLTVDQGRFFQLGQSIDGEAPIDRSGGALALSSDGTTLAIGAFLNDGPGNDRGHLRMFRFNPTISIWEQLGSDIDGTADSDFFGNSVTISANGNIVACGAPGNDAGGPSAGQVRAFEFDGNDWVQRGQNINGLKDFDNEGGARGVSLSADGNRLATSAVRPRDKGQTRVFEFDEINDEWVQLGDSIFGDTSAFDGTSISLSGSGAVLAVGGPSHKTGGFVSSGRARVFQFVNSGVPTWAQLGDDVLGEADIDRVGSSVSLSRDGTRLAIGALGNSCDGDDCFGDPSPGSVKVFQFNGPKLETGIFGEGDWTQIGQTLQGEGLRDVFGGSVSLSDNGTTLAVGAFGNDEGGSNAGSVRVFRFDEAESLWVQLASDIDGDQENSFFGSVSMSANGNVLAIGGSGLDTPSGGQRSGQVRVFKFKVNPPPVKNFVVPCFKKIKGLCNCSQFLKGNQCFAKKAEKNCEFPNGNKRRKRFLEVLDQRLRKFCKK